MKEGIKEKNTRQVSKNLIPSIPFIPSITFPLEQLTTFFLKYYMPLKYFFEKNTPWKKTTIFSSASK